MSIVDSEFSVNISIPENIASEMKDPPKPIQVKFKSKEEKTIYIQEEYKATQSSLRALASAWTKEQRQNAYIALYKTRNAFCDKFLREELARLKEITEPESAWH